MNKLPGKQNCTGCYACLNICPQNCISMDTDEEGFWYPVIDMNRCTECRLCEEACPVINDREVNKDSDAFACINNDENIRLQSSSGGIFSLIAEKIIEDSGVVFGARFDDKFSVVHDYVETKEGLKKFRGSKYVQSMTGDSYIKAKEFLNQGRIVLFSGTPCQIAGLKSFLRNDYDNLFTIDLICHGVPSPKVWQEYINYREKISDSKTRRIAFRRKDEGWKLYSLSFKFQNDKEYIQTLNRDLYMKAFLKDVCLRPTCYNCQFKSLNRESDITLGDFWGIQKMLPEMYDDKGTSLIFVNSNRGRKLFDNIKDKMEYNRVDIKEAVRYNSAAVKSVEYNPKREDFFKELGEIPFDKLVKKYCSDTLLVRTKKKTKSILRLVLKNLGLLDIIKKYLR